MIRRKIAILATLVIFLLSATAGAVVQPREKSNEIIPAGAKWLLETEGLGGVNSIIAPNADFQRRNGSLWTQRNYGPAGRFSRIWGKGVALQASVMNDSMAAKESVERFWSENSDLFPAGVKIADFRLIENEKYRDIRYVGHRQVMDGYPILGTGIFAAIKNSRISLMGIRAFPNEPAKEKHLLLESEAHRIVFESLSILGMKGTVIKSEKAWLPLLSGDDMRLSPVYRVGIRTETKGRWTAYVDASNGSLIALKDERLFLQGHVDLVVHDRNPVSSTIPRPAANLKVQTSLSDAYLDAEGMVSVDAATTSLSLDMVGRYTRINNLAGSRLTASVPDFGDGDRYLWVDDSEFGMAQLDAYRFVADVRKMGREIQPSLEWLDELLVVNVNRNETCNAWFDGELTFLREGRDQYGNSCHNTAQIADVVYHEFGHGLHYFSMGNAVGEFDEAASEGFADFNSALLTKDRYLAPYFMTSGGALRDIEPNKSWPDDISQEDPHLTGLIIGGALWDMRKALIADLGEEVAWPVILRIFGGVLRLTTTIPTSYEAALFADDDNGDLSDGTPHVCAIDAAFGEHGLVTEAAGGLTIRHDVVNNLVPDGHPIPILATVGAAHPQCGNIEAGGVRLVYSVDGGNEWVTTPMTAAGENTFSAEIPEPPANTQVRYRIEADPPGGGDRVTRPNNLAEPFYYMWVGSLEEINCDDFESGENGWSHDLLSGENREGADDWQLGTPGGLGGDPSQAYSGTHVWGNDLSPEDNWNGQYQSDKINTLISPEFDLSAYEDVRLQFRRWLSVEDASYDKARIYVNEQVVWTNARGDGELHHEDKEWILFDLDITDQAAGEEATVFRFEIESDQGLEFGGWNIDDFCLYTMVESPSIEDGDITDGDVTDGDVTDGDVVDGDVADGDVSDGDVADGDITDGDVTDGDATDGDIEDGDTTDGDFPLPDGDIEDGDLEDGDIPDDDFVVDADDEDGDDDGRSAGTGGGGCSTAAGGGAGWLALAWLLARRRRRLF